MFNYNYLLLLCVTMLAITSLHLHLKLKHLMHLHLKLKSQCGSGTNLMHYIPACNPTGTMAVAWWWRSAWRAAGSLTWVAAVGGTATCWVSWWGSRDTWPALTWLRTRYLTHSAQAWTIGSRTTDWTRTKSRDMLFHPVSILLVSVTPKRHMSLYQAVIGVTVSSWISSLNWDDNIQSAQ